MSKPPPTPQPTPTPRKSANSPETKTNSSENMTDEWGPNPHKTTLTRRAEKHAFQAPKLNCQWPLERQRIGTHLLAECHDRSFICNERREFSFHSRSMMYFTLWQQTYAVTRFEAWVYSMVKMLRSQKRSSCRGVVVARLLRSCQSQLRGLWWRTTGRRILAITWCWL